MAQSISVQDFNKLPLDADSIVLDTRNTGSLSNDVGKEKS